MKSLNLILIATTLFMVSCKKDPKDKSTIHGVITYVGSVTGTEYYANGAHVELYSGTSIEANVTADANGNYSFSNVKDGTHTIYASGTYTLISYSGEASISVSGEDNKTLSIKMK